MIERRKERRQAALQRHEERQQAALERRAAKLGLKTPASPAVATATPAVMAGAIESPAPSPAALIGTAAPHDGKEAPTLSDLVARHAIENGIPVKLAQAVVTIESRGNAHASNHGALGLMQIKYGTARAAGFSGAAAGLMVAETNLHFGMKVLADAYRSARGDLCGTLMRYQSGHLATRMTRSNRAYCSRARSLMAGA
ncbi:MAG TPA: transglycosylase SLT domain-containing protein [Lichenihabitans sp.]|jgi:soluble lytic murein transglycosylase-like protein|nr:transglycosylase SLT domain-containing protein [Lichenihabitans sp.]